VPPNEFIPVAETGGLIVPIGAWILESACSLLKQWENVPQRKNWTIAVNVSERQMRQPDFVSQVQQIVGRTLCNPELIKLELTESLLQHDIDATIEKMHALRAMGIRFSIDDFGTGKNTQAHHRRRRGRDVQSVQFSGGIWMRPLPGLPVQ
jgi:EAL domain-containing protein (putative c-di-GMP-specific phosphodiesterase class I)